MSSYLTLLLQNRQVGELASKLAESDAKSAAHAEKVKALTSELAGIEGRDADYGKTPEMKALEAQTKQLEAERKEHQERLQRGELRLKKAEEALAAAKAKSAESGTMRRTFKRTGGPLVLGSISFADVDTVREEMTLCLGPGSTSGWVLVGYKDDKNVVFHKSGMGGVEELAQHLRDNEMQYAIVRVTTSLASDGGLSDSQSLRDVLIQWCGPAVKILEKGKKKPHIIDVKKVLQPTQSELFVTNKAAFTTATVSERSNPLSKKKEID